MALVSDSPDPYAADFAPVESPGAHRGRVLDDDGLEGGEQAVATGNASLESYTAMVASTNRSAVLSGS